MTIKLLLSTWNTRGLGQSRKRDDVRAAVEAVLPTILCIQESKLSDISRYLTSSFLPPSLRSFVFKPSIGASGGIVTAWNDSVLELLDHSINDFSVSTTFSFHLDNLSFCVINVYGPCDHSQKSLFLESLTQAFNAVSGPVVVMGDFNPIRFPRDRSNDNFN